MGAIVAAPPDGLLALAERAGATIATWCRWESASMEGYRMDIICECCPRAALEPYEQQHRLLVVDVQPAATGGWSILVLA